MAPTIGSLMPAVHSTCEARCARNRGRVWWSICMRHPDPGRQMDHPTNQRFVLSVHSCFSRLLLVNLAVEPVGTWLLFLLF